jgi:hypothetical protein
MKAVFVIDLPVALENLLGEELLLYINHKDDRYIMTEECKLRPLPKQFTTDEILMAKDVKTAIEMRAYNDCLEEITGETE